MMIRKILGCIGVICICSARGQNNSLLYDYTEIPQSLLLNPGANIGFSWYAGIPALSGIGFQAGSTGFSYNDLFANDGTNFTTKIRRIDLLNLDTKDELTASFQLEILSAGFRSRKKPKNFYSFGMYLQSDHQVYWPEDIALLGYNGNAGELGRRFDLGDLKLQGYLRNVLHFGLNRAVNKKLVLGGRAKIYSGIINYVSTRNSGYFLTRPGIVAPTANTMVANMRLQTSGIERFREIIGNSSGSTELSGEIIKRSSFGGDIGLGLDVGFTYYLSDQLLVTGSLLDWGLMSNFSDVRTFELKDQKTIEGGQPISRDALAGANEDFWQDLADEIDALVPFVENQDSFLSFNSVMLYSSIRYNFGEYMQPNTKSGCNCDYRNPGNSLLASLRSPYRNGLGLQLYVKDRPRGPQSAVTLFYQRQMFRALSFKTTYTADKFSKTNIGLGLNLQTGPVELYVLADNLLGLQNLANSRYASFQIGLNILSW